MRLFDTDGSTLRDATWTMEYNDLNQLTDRATGTGAAGDERWAYAYDAGGNLVAATQETSNGSVWSVSEEWVYQWNPRDQMTRALKYAGGSANNAGSVSFEDMLCRESFLGTRFSRIPIRNVTVPGKRRMLKRGKDSRVQKEREGILVPAVVILRTPLTARSRCPCSGVRHGNWRAVLRMPVMIQS